MVAVLEIAIKPRAAGFAIEWSDVRISELAVLAVQRTRFGFVSNLFHILAQFAVSNTTVEVGLRAVRV